MIFRMAVGGNLTGQTDVVRQIDELTGQIKAYLVTEGAAQEIQVEWLVNPSYTGPGWKNKAMADHVPMHGFCLKQEEDWSGECDTVVSADGAFRGLAADWFCTAADLVLLVWGEEIAEKSGATWELMQHVYQKKVPCVWISAKNHQIYWLQNGYYGDYSPEYLKTLCQSLVACRAASDDDMGKTIPFLELGDRLQQRFLRRYQAESKAQEAEKDCLLQEEYKFQGGSENSGTIHKRLLSEFRQYDKKAIELGGKYRAIMYWRAILPLMASLAIAVGFYAETLLGIIPVPWNRKPGLWAILAAFGFLIHGMLNLYVYFLSKDKLVRSWHRGYIDNRNFAEIYRVLVHFLPYGISLNIRRLCGKRQDMYAAVRNVTGELQMTSFTLDSGETREMLEHVSEMLEDQISYHRSSAERYRRVSKRLEQWNQWLFAAGFVIVILRGFFQFFIAYMPLSGEINGIAVNSYVRSFANMAALLVPAWASYFASKLNQCNYRYHAGNHQEMEQRIQIQLERIQQLQRMEGGLPLEVLNTLSEEIAELMLVEDTGEWYGKVASSTVKSL